MHAHAIFLAEGECCMNNSEILQIAMRQHAIDCNCEPEDFCSSENKVVLSRENALARRYLKLPFFCDLVSYGSNIVASVDIAIRDAVSDYIGKYAVAHCFETPNLHVLNRALEQHGMRICFMAEYFLPDVNRVAPLSCPYEMRILTPADFADLYLPEWSNALGKSRRQLDMLAVGAFDGEKLAGLAGCSADCESMWQIGIDVLPGYRRMGIASALTSRLALEILALGKVPFYCCAWSNIQSVKNAILSGFRPAWVEMTAKSAAFVEEMNG